MQPIIFHHLSMPNKNLGGTVQGFHHFRHTNTATKRLRVARNPFGRNDEIKLSHHFTSLSFFILGPASFNETTSHPSSRRRIIKSIKHHWSKNTTPNQSNYWTYQISSELGAFPFRLDQPDCLTHLHSELCLSTTALVGLTPDSLRGWGRCDHSEFVELDKNAKPFILKWICLVWQPWNWNSKTKERKLTRVVVCQHRRSQIREPKMLVGNSKFFTAATKARAKCWCLKLCHAFLISNI